MWQNQIHVAQLQFRSHLVVVQDLTKLCAYSIYMQLLVQYCLQTECAYQCCSVGVPDGVLSGTNSLHLSQHLQAARMRVHNRSSCIIFDSKGKVFATFQGESFWGLGSCAIIAVKGESYHCQQVAPSHQGARKSLCAPLLHSRHLLPACLQAAAPLLSAAMSLQLSWLVDQELSQT